MMLLCGLESRKELFNNAFSLLEWVVLERLKGRSIASVNEAEKSFRELHMPIFTKLRASQGLVMTEEQAQKGPMEPTRSHQHY